MLSFGTDGIRGRWPEEINTQEISRIGWALAEEILSSSEVSAGKSAGESASKMAGNSAKNSEHMAVVGYDSRESSPKLAADIAEVLGKKGIIVQQAGLTTTPAVAFLSASRNIFGIVITASHNPHFYNGVKLFMPGGLKPDDDCIDRIERSLKKAAPSSEAATAEPASADNPAPAYKEAHLKRNEPYLKAIYESLENQDLSGLSILTDSANGAISAFLPEAFENLGVQTDNVVCETSNINENCGAAHPELLCEQMAGQMASQTASQTTSSKKMAGFAFDGDADRVLAADENGRLINGDELLAILALDHKKRKGLDSVVVTVMTNLGFHNAMGKNGISVETTPVGDRFVSEKMQQTGSVLGGEQSGHIIFRDFSTTGDGLLTALQILDVMKRSGKPLSQLAAESMTALPQVLKNISVESPEEVLQKISEEISTAENNLGGKGRVLVRPSGTEMLLRIMAEAEDTAQAQSAVEFLEKAAFAAAGQS